MNARGCKRFIRSLVVLGPLAALYACTPAVMVESTRTEVSVGGGESDQSPQGAPTTQNAMDALQQQLQNREREVEQLRAQVQQLGGVPAGGAAAAAQDHAGAVGGAAAAAPAADAAAQIASLRLELTHERERREAVETELARLKEETSLPGFGDGRVPESDFLAVKQELVDLRRSAAEDHEARVRLAAQLLELQQAGTASAAAAPDAENPQQRAQLDDLHNEKDQLVQNLNQRLVASQQRTAELETALAAAKTGGTTAAGDGTLAAENAALKTRLEEQRHRTEDLEAKLRVAARVQDLIYRLESQQAAPAAPRRQPKRAPAPAEIPPNRFDHSPSTE